MVNCRFLSSGLQTPSAGRFDGVNQQQQAKLTMNAQFQHQPAKHHSYCVEEAGDDAGSESSVRHLTCNSPELSDLDDDEDDGDGRA